MEILGWSVDLDPFWRVQPELYTRLEMRAVADAPEGDSPVVSVDVDEAVETLNSSVMALTSKNLSFCWLYIRACHILMFSQKFNHRSENLRFICIETRRKVS